MSHPTTARRWRAAARPAVIPLSADGPASGWELVAINSRTATLRHMRMVGEMAVDADAIAIVDPLPWLTTTGERTAQATAGATWEPRSISQMRREQVWLPLEQRSPYDTGERAQPQLWRTVVAAEIHRMPEKEAREQLDRYGRVDFDDDSGSTLATVYITPMADGSAGYAVHIDTETAPGALYIGGKEIVL